MANEDHAAVGANFCLSVGTVKMCTMAHGLSMQG